VPQDTFEFRVAYRKLLIGLLVTIVPISFAALYAVSQSARSLNHTIGSHYSTLAESTASQVTQFIHSQVIEVGLMAANPAVVDAVAAANRSYQGMTDAAIAEKVQRAEEMWLTPRADALVSPILSSRASQSLRRYLQIDPTFLRITVTDGKGATVAATHKTIDYYQADEEYWRSIYADGRGSVSVTDVSYDVVTKNNYIGIGVPITEPETGQFLGTLDALVEVSSLFPIVRRAEVGPGGHALLVKDDGTVISGPRTTLAMSLKSDEHNALVDASTNLAGRHSGYLIANFPERGETLIAFADTGLREDFNNLGWLVLVSQPTEQAFAPINTTQQLIMLIAFLGLAAVVVLGVYFALHRKTEVEEIEQEFHPGHPSRVSSA
jgi:hypothetical protein